MLNHDEIIEQALQLVNRNELENAMKSIEQLLNKSRNNKDLIEHATNIKDRISSYNKSEVDGWENAEKKESAENKLRYSILNLISKIKYHLIDDGTEDANVLDVKQKTAHSSFTLIGDIILVLIFLLTLFFLVRG